MTQIRQDAWSSEEDQLLAKIVLQYIENGHTQMDAFKEAAKGLRRTPAACGFRWNATLRQHYLSAINEARHKRNSKGKEEMKKQQTVIEKDNPIASAIALLEKVNPELVAHEQKNYEAELLTLKTENEALQKQVLLYKEAWQEMEKIWQWRKDHQD